VEITAWGENEINVFDEVKIRGVVTIFHEINVFVGIKVWDEIKTLNENVIEVGLDLLDTTFGVPF
jgi:hypothetical protein